jgi:hypothetical protein
MFPQGKEGAALRLDVGGKVFPLGSADGAEENSVGLFTGFDCVLGERGFIVGGIESSAADEVLWAGDFEGEFFRDGVEDVEGFDHDFRADAVAWKDGDGVGHGADLAGNGNY